MSARATVLSSFAPWTRTVTFADFSSTLTTVAAVATPLTVTLTLSPALSGGLTDALGPGDGETGAGAAGDDSAGVAGFVFPLAFELFSLLGSQAASVSASSNTAKSFFVMIVLHLC
jgi:hypothetical protein